MNLKHSAILLVTAAIALLISFNFSEDKNLNLITAIMFVGFYIAFTIDNANEKLIKTIKEEKKE